jgi:hypothetical protein
MHNSKNNYSLSLNLVKNTIGEICVRGCDELNCKPRDSVVDFWIFLQEILQYKA